MDNNNNYNNNNNNNNQGKKLYKSSTNRMVCGVCAGIGDYFGIDATIIRLLMVLFTFCSFGTGVVAYFVMAIVVPDAPFRN